MPVGMFGRASPSPPLAFSRAGCALSDSLWRYGITTETFKNDRFRLDWPRGYSWQA